MGTLLFEMLTGLPPFYNQNLHVMYEKIIRAKVNYPAHLSDSAKLILSDLLERNPAKRLGTVGGASEIKKHPFFSSIDWIALNNKQSTVPFKPQTTEGKYDTTNIDDEFKRETPKDTPIIESSLRTKVNFPGFTFAAPESVLNSSELQGK